MPDRSGRAFPRTPHLRRRGSNRRPELQLCAHAEQSAVDDVALGVAVELFVLAGVPGVKIGFAQPLQQVTLQWCCRCEPLARSMRRQQMVSTAIGWAAAPGYCRVVPAAVV